MVEKISLSWILADDKKELSCHKGNNLNKDGTNKISIFIRGLSCFPYSKLQRDTG